MSNTNVVVLTGNLGDNVDYRVFPKSQKGVAELRIAVNKHRFNGDTQQFDTITSWVTIKMYGQLADRANEKLSKGAKIAIEGELVEDNWVEQPSGQKRSKLYVVASSFEYLGGGTRTTQNANQGNQQSQPSPQQSRNAGSQRKRPPAQNQQKNGSHNQTPQNMPVSERPLGY